jgi:hypothetical protein
MKVSRYSGSVYSVAAFFQLHGIGGDRRPKHPSNTPGKIRASSEMVKRESSSDHQVIIK